MTGSVMIKIPGGRVRVGSDVHYPEERPAHEIETKPFWIDRTAVTNAAFAEFVAATRWVTTAERPERPGSLVFHMSSGPVDLHDPRQWWSFVSGASWRCPEGPGSDLEGRDDHPVVHVSKHDALAYASWRGVRLPDEWEWEAACRGGLFGASYAWGNTFDSEQANIWIGAFPWYFARGEKPGTCAVDRHPANGYGLVGMIGNVWEWTSSDFAGDTCCGAAAAKGAVLTSLRGGSYLCAAEYCLRYRPAARIGQEAATTTGHIGFRCAQDD
ncbi:formylglycine-generating enzyme family protein [Bradyrhizobium sp.]|jgi:formylglycine-generating enzyme required for sulfatase activity|uniref:formylglycine-generating enzyme family protein n=1 Tax=Bradyrhizobium sp. TaxID=376 RepID=UPI002C7B08FF|nr:formylglycine-generating enzyme family protein [Bradyrhizobium sp.]HWX62539.1 formylglycine-generating enzyme family protein [Bradyrhizobium sp.]